MQYTIGDLLADHQMFHSEFQMDHFITCRAGGRTDYGRYKQALRELSKRTRGLQELRVERELLDLDIIYLETTWCWSHYRRVRNRIEAKQKRAAVEELDRQLRDTEREHRRFFLQARVLKDRVGELTAERRAELEEEAWIETLKMRAAIEARCTMSRFSPETLDMVAALPARLRARMAEEMADEQKLVEWMDKECPDELLEDRDADRIHHNR